MPDPDQIRPSPPVPTNVFLVYGSLRTGGIETLIVRIANFFASSGVRVSVCCTAGGELGTILDPQVNIIVYRETHDLVWSGRTHVNEMSSGSPVLIISFDPISAGRALMLETGLPRKLLVTHISGVFHPRAYFMTSERKDRIFLNYLVARAIGKKLVFFMNVESRESHSIKWKTDLSRSQIVALPINHVDATWQPSSKTGLRIVSVGRLVEFKRYNLGAPRIARECLNRGLKVTWDIYGDGPLHSSVKTEIETLGVTNNVRLMGPIEYSDFAEKVADYDLFVGMGTAALEAAMVGVPTICATVDAATRCYGYLHALPYGNVGEVQENPPTLELADLIHTYSECGQEQRTLLSRQSRAAAEKYGMREFAEAIASLAVQRQASPNRFVKRLVGELYRFTTESHAVRAVRRHKLKKRRAAYE